jgi:hypothetical protein
MPGNIFGPEFLIFSAPSQRESVVTRSEIRSNSPSFTVSPAAKRSSVTRPSSVARTSCSIFMASRITSTSPVRTVSPGATNHWTIWACRGERNSVMGEIVGAPPTHTASSGRQPRSRRRRHPQSAVPASAAKEAPTLPRAIQTAQFPPICIWYLAPLEKVQVPAPW